MSTRQIAPHGTLSRAKWHKCPCIKCHDRVRTYENERFRLMAYGRWQPLVDAEPVRRHLEALNAAGFSYQVIARHLGLTSPYITRLVYPINGKPPQKRVGTERAAQILAITPDDLTPGLLFATGSTRRIRALYAAGWPSSAIGARMGRSGERIRMMTTQQLILTSTAAEVSAAYEEMKDTDPAAAGIPKGTIVRLRRHAQRNNWPDPVWWDDWGHIDDPAFDPAEAERTSRAQEAADRKAEIAFLASYGLTNDEIGARLGMRPASVRDIRNGRTAA